MKFRNYIALSVILHIILFLLLLHLPEREKKESEPFFVSLEELPVHAKDTPKLMPKPALRSEKKKAAKKKAPPEKKKEAAKKPLQMQPKRTVPEQENVLPEAIRGALKKPKKTEHEKKEIAQKDKGIPEKSEKKQEGSKVEQKKKHLLPVEKKTEPKKIEPPKKKIAQKKPPKKKVKSKPNPSQKKITQKSSPEKKVQSKPEPPKKKIAQKRPVEKRGKYKPDVPQKKSSLQSDTSVTENKGRVLKSQESQKTDKGETSHKPKRIKLAQLYDKDSINEAALKSRDTQKGVSNKKGSDSVISFDTTEFHLVGYMPRLRQRIESIWRYPPAAARKGLYGDLYISFTILKDGSLSKVELVRTSGYKVLDDAAIKALKEGQPYWPLPKSWPHDNLTITGHFFYVSRGGYYLR